MSNIQDIIVGAFEERANISPSNASSEIKTAVIEAIDMIFYRLINTILLKQ